jgi:hypothetical protein
MKFKIVWPTQIGRHAIFVSLKFTDRKVIGIFFPNRPNHSTRAILKGNLAFVSKRGWRWACSEVNIYNIKNMYVSYIGQPYFKHPLAYNTIDLSPIMKKHTQKIYSAIFSDKQ